MQGGNKVLAQRLPCLSPNRAPCPKPKRSTRCRTRTLRCPFLSIESPTIRCVYQYTCSPNVACGVCAANRQSSSSERGRAMKNEEWTERHGPRLWDLGSGTRRHSMAKLQGVSFRRATTQNSRESKYRHQVSRPRAGFGCSVLHKLSLLLCDCACFRLATLGLC